tara:strand:- start:2914 stop:3192 length:279 start_codon:yes stop_codon:yes gene_type:complete
MPVSNLAAIAALALTVYKEVPNFINKKDEQIDLYYVILSLIVSTLWCYYHYSNNNPMGKVGSTFFLGINIILLVRCLQQRTGFLKERTSPSE